MLALNLNRLKGMTEKKIIQNAIIVAMFAAIVIGGYYGIKDLLFSLATGMHRAQ